MWGFLRLVSYFVLCFKWNLQVLESFHHISKYSIRADTFAAVDTFLPNLTDLTLFHYLPCLEINLKKCLRLKSLNLRSARINLMSSLARIPILCEMDHLANVTFYNLLITSYSISTFDHLSALHTLAFDRCRIECNWYRLGVALAQTPLKSLILRVVRCDVQSVESLLGSVNLQHFFLSIFVTSKSADALFNTFADAFTKTRKNPTSFLIELKNMQNLNGTIYPKGLSSSKWFGWIFFSGNIICFALETWFTRQEVATILEIPIPHY